MQEHEKEVQAAAAAEDEELRRALQLSLVETRMPAAEVPLDEEEKAMLEQAIRMSMLAQEARARGGRARRGLPRGLSCVVAAVLIECKEEEAEGLPPLMPALARRSCRRTRAPARAARARAWAQGRRHPPRAPRSAAP